MNPRREISAEELSLTAEIANACRDNEVVIEALETKAAFVPKIKDFLRDNALLFLTMTGIVAGFALGFGIREATPSKDALMWLGMPGELFLRMLQMMILPLISCTVITGTASLDPRSNGKISAVAFGFIVSTNIIACLVAVLLCLAIKPGVGQLSASGTAADQEPVETQDIFADILRDMFPDNMMEATFRKSQTQYRKETEVLERNATNGTTLSSKVMSLSKYAGKADGINVLGLIVICTVVGIAINQLKDKATTLFNFFVGATHVVLLIMRWFFWLTPLGVASLIAVSIAGVADISSAFAQLGKFVLVVSVGILLHQFLILPTILFAITRRNPLKYFAKIVRPCIIGFASTSAAVAIPEMLESCEKNKVDSRVARFVIPFCVTLNSDGSALYITSAAIFISHLTGVGVEASDYIVIGVLTAVAAMAIPSVPSASIVTLVVILTSLNIPTNDIALLFAVEWFLDRIRTTCNIVSHTFCAAVTHKFCQKNLQSGQARDKCESTDSDSDDISRSFV